jgi:RimJ/RimL family protein N-acetyltransferase
MTGNGCASTISIKGTAFAERYHAGQGWTFLTGSAADIERLSERLGSYGRSYAGKTAAEAAPNDVLRAGDPTATALFAKEARMPNPGLSDATFTRWPTLIPSADYSSDLEDDLTLPNDRRLHIRPLQRCEHETIRAFYARLSPRTRYLRFFSPMPTLPDSVLRLLTCVDHQRSLALVAENGTTGRDVVGLASFGAIDGDRVEVALVVRDDWQHQGVGLQLASRVLQAAEERGFHRFLVNVTSDNVAIRRLLKHVGDVVSARASGGVSEIEFVRRPHHDGA